MSNSSKKIQRHAEKKRNKAAQKRIKQQLGLFEKIPSACLTCEKPFDKMNKEDVNSFRVVVREAEEQVNLYCDSCWNKAINILQEFEKKT